MPRQVVEGKGSLLALSGCDLFHPGSYVPIAPSSGDPATKTFLSVLRCRASLSAGVTCDRPTPEELRKSDPDKNCICSWNVDHNEYRTEPGSIWQDPTGFYGKFFRCLDGKGWSCGESDVNFGHWPPLHCDSSDPNTWILAEDANGNTVYRPCGTSDCLGPSPDGSPVYDACGFATTYGYGSPGWWNGDTSHQGETVCLGDAYRIEHCHRPWYDAAVVHQMKMMPLPSDLVETIKQECENDPNSGGDASGKSITALPLPAECYLGQLGASVVKGYGALEDVELAKLAWGAAQESYNIQGRVCAELNKDKENTTSREMAFTNEMNSWREAKLVADSLAVAASNAASSGASFGASNIATGFQIYSLNLQTKMEKAQQDFDNFMRDMTQEQQVRECFAEANKLQAQFEVEKGQIVRRATDLAAAKQEFSRILAETERAYAEGMAALEREKGRSAPSFAFHYWYEEKAERYLREFKWAKRLVYLAMRAVEYEFQQNLSLRKDILTAKHPDQLEGAIRSMQAEVATRAINRRRPQELSVVLSLRDDVLGLIDMSRIQGDGERKATPVRSLQHRLWDPKYAIYDKDGKWAGQGVPFTLMPQGSLTDRCAERLWRVTATVQGDGLSDSEPGSALRLMKKNTFYSQWCEGKGDDSKMQIGQLQPSKNLFKDDPGPTNEGENNAYSTAAIYPWFNVRRSDFYKTTYQDGASEELAGRGVYGDYVLLFPAELLEGMRSPNPSAGELQGTRIDRFPLNRVEDVLIRFDYLSVDNFAARGAQPQP